MKGFCVFLLIVLLAVSGCGPNKKRLLADITGVAVTDVKIHRYDLDLFHVDPAQLRQGMESLKPAYRFFLGADLSNPVKLAEMKSYLDNPRNQDFHREVTLKYRDLGPLEKALTEAFRHYKYYYPQRRLPRVYSYISGGDYDYPVQFADSVMIIGLDNYLGQNFKVYVADGLPVYRVTRMTPDDILPDCMKVLGEISYPNGIPGNTLLAQMIQAGKRCYFIDAMIPAVEDRLKIGYTKAQYDWMMKNEQHVWAAIIENRFLYASDGQLIRTFMADGPFTAEFSREAPSRMGEWIGWQIVKSYMANHEEVTLDNLFSEPDPQRILTLSKYKPDK